jgi:hypothetical protein
MKVLPRSAIKFLLCFLLLTFQSEPDEYVDFTAYLSENRVSIQWIARNCNKIEKFSVERSSDNKTFSEIRTVINQGKKPDIAEFVESDFKPLYGWSYYRISFVTKRGDVLITHSVPLFYKADRMQKGEILVPDSLTAISEVATISATEFHNVRLVFILRNKGGEEFYLEESLIVEGDKLFLPASSTLPAGEYMISACTKTPLLGLKLTAK